MVIIKKLFKAAGWFHESANQGHDNANWTLRMIGENLIGIHHGDYSRLKNLTVISIHS